MKTVLAFGDSLTFGANPTGEGRHDKAYRWPEVVATETGFDVVTEGLRGRTTAFDHDVIPANLNGAALLPSLLHSHAPIDLLAIMLGTNDCNFGFGPRNAQLGLTRLVEITRTHPFRSIPQAPPQILLIAPPPMRLDAAGEVTEQMILDTQELPRRIAQVAEKTGTHFFDASTVAEASELDGIHLDAANTAAIGAALAPVVKSILAR